MPSLKLLLFGVAALLATAVYYVLVTATDASLLVIVAMVVLVGIGFPQLILYTWKATAEGSD